MGAGASSRCRRGAAAGRESRACWETVMHFQRQAPAHVLHGSQVRTVPGATQDHRGRTSLADVEGGTTTGPLDPASQAWLRDLRAGGPPYDAAVARLHTLLLRAARFEVGRRRS